MAITLYAQDAKHLQAALKIAQSIGKVGSAVDKEVWDAAIDAEAGLKELLRLCVKKAAATEPETPLFKESNEEGQEASE